LSVGKKGKVRLAEGRGRGQLNKGGKKAEKGGRKGVHSIVEFKRKGGGDKRETHLMSVNDDGSEETGDAGGKVRVFGSLGGRPRGAGGGESPQKTVISINMML